MTDDHRKAMRLIERRLVLKQSLSLGALSLLTGCNLQDDDLTDRLLWAMSRWNDDVQARLFSRARLAQTFPESSIVRPFPSNGIYPADDPPIVDPVGYRLELGGRIADRRPWSLERLRKLPLHTQITRHICIEGWSAIGQWRGVPLGLFLYIVGADLRARYVSYQCADRYYGAIDMASALHPQTILAIDQDNAPLPPPNGTPIKIRVPTKLGFKNPKHVLQIGVTNDDPGGYWEDQGYNWFSGL